MTESLEDYLEAIFILSRDKGIVRVKDIALKMEVKNPSVLGALKELEAKNYLSHEKYGGIELTQAGINAAEAILRKHNMLKDYLVRFLGVSDKNAETDACKMEHMLSDETLLRIEEIVSIKTDN